ncbi:3-phosphoshikimate 1-carboxyvinyltransferase [Aquimarina sp. U1-2]|uniref:3-phosphoshikimate 1-carboxyvinyltransferase n=1 Tax=Aquimarina sp. U1-2 TaxID=2823141 RepID=UPI001AEC8B6A|nr:3-phosphoshikimate 1-carboxyvinyltransferase [Aquimarina sp. U1-2]MBP2833721.1 3-phosphoshikimate 1-carboxyvinyltransferase [Aquimarina sp. U1-2]
MSLKLAYIPTIENTTLKITGSKSETNRILILQALYPDISIENMSNSDDSQLMQKALQSDEMIVDIHHAGTAMRFLTAFFAINDGREIILTGSQRMQERPIKILVDALRQIGCEISYEKEEGYPPIKIIGKQPLTRQIELKANVSSQYISALMLVAASLPKGLIINLQGKVTSIPYINMTLRLLEDVGIAGTFEHNKIVIPPNTKKLASKITVESDWSSASYYYGIIALANVNVSVTLKSYKKQSYQGDSALAGIYKHLGVKTAYHDHSITLTKVMNDVQMPETLDLSNSPDIAQTIVVSCFGLKLGCFLTGLHTLKIKETDRLQALKVEIEKLGGVITITNDTLCLEPASSIRSDISIATYNDHRMAMAFAPLALRTSINIEDPDVVSKSYPDFWSDLKKLGFKIL